MRKLAEGQVLLSIVIVVNVQKVSHRHTTRVAQDDKAPVQVLVNWEEHKVLLKMLTSLVHFLTRSCAAL